jgi:hypothetical protein
MLGQSRWTSMLTLLVSLGACAPRDQIQEPAPHDTTRVEAPRNVALTTSLQAAPTAQGVYFALQVTNASDQPLSLEFTSGQSFDFAVAREGRVVWRWSDDQMFTQALRSERLAPGETKRYEATWPQPAGASGSYTVVGTLTASNHRVEETTTFQLP